MLVKSSRYFFLLLVGCILWSSAYILPAVFCSLIVWDSSVYLAMTTHPAYGAVFGVMAIMFAVIAIDKLVKEYA